MLERKQEHFSNDEIVIQCELERAKLTIRFYGDRFDYTKQNVGLRITRLKVDNTNFRRSSFPDNIWSLVPRQWLRDFIALHYHYNTQYIKCK